MIVGFRRLMIVDVAQGNRGAWLFEQMRDEFLNAHRLDAARTAAAFLGWLE